MMNKDQSLQTITRDKTVLFDEVPHESKSPNSCDIKPVKRENMSRSHDRRDYFMHVYFNVNDRLHNGFVKNICSGGVFIDCQQDTTQKISLGQVVTLTFDHPNRRKHIKVTGKIARTENYGFGVSFKDPLLDLETTDS